MPDWNEPNDYLASKDNYARLRRKLILLLNGRGCADAPQLADEAVLRTVQALSKGHEVRDIEAFAVGVAKKIMADWVAEGRRPAPPPPVGPLKPSLRARCLDGCLRKLSPPDREMVEAYFVDRDREALAIQLRVSLNALRIRVCRLKAQLASCTDDCLASSGTKRNWPNSDT